MYVRAMFVLVMKMCTFFKISTCDILQRVFDPRHFYTRIHQNQVFCSLLIGTETQAVVIRHNLTSHAASAANYDVSLTIFVVSFACVLVPIRAGMTFTFSLLCNQLEAPVHVKLLIQLRCSRLMLFTKPVQNQPLCFAFCC